MQLTPITWPKLAEALAERVATTDPPGPWWRLAVDGAPAAGTADLADAVAAALPALGRPALRVRAADFWRPASIRLEYGHEDVDAYYQLWLDTGSLRREVLDPLGPGGTGSALPSLRDPVTDRSVRAYRVQLPPGGVLVLDGPLLLGQGLPLDLTVHLRLSRPALTRRTAPADHWTLPAYDRYAREVLPEETADVLVHADDARHPAWTG
ncbi:uridine kinase [Actinacidiphila acididurans]|uniref:Uridine kinase n=1 Tax=Actinacidiphila acididurans TaxID=2784346 RepID=A0ABS2U5P3_9ACTN|nr:uridine kinase [Actinacidiphila acididurans]MBM9510337.1 uridine kinase [Actinacidiphila acididurans]